MGKYRYNIGLNDKYHFGIELEFTNVYLDILSKVFHESTLPVKYALHHKTTGFTKYDEWYLDIDSSVTKRINERFLGGELSSRILVDEKRTWEELKAICNILKNAQSTVNENCSIHIRVDLSNVKNTAYFFEVLSKLVAIYEIEMKQFYMGDSYLIRKASFEYARDLSSHLIDYINDVDFSHPSYIYKFKSYKGINYFTRRDAINLQDYHEKKLIEFRYANGTLNEKTIQNNTNFTTKLVDAIIRELFDPEELSSKIYELKNADWITRTFRETSQEDFEFLAKTISTSPDDVNDFMSQYEKVLTKKREIN